MNSKTGSKFPNLFFDGLDVSLNMFIREKLSKSKEKGKKGDAGGLNCYRMPNMGQVAVHTPHNKPLQGFP